MRKLISPRLRGQLVALGAGFVAGLIAMLAGACAAFLIFYTPSAKAGEVIVHGVTVHGKKSYHEDGVKKSYNNTNVGIGYGFDNGVTLGVYDNSYNRTSVYVAYRYSFTPYVGVVGGYATGYQGHTSGVIGGLHLRSPDLGDGWRLNLFAQPFSVGDTTSVYSLAITKRY